MRLPQAAPEEGGRDEREHFTHWSIGAKERHFAYVAGPCQWFVCHPSERTKPCLRWFTKNALPCKWCAKKVPTAQCGYLPLWRQVDWRPKFCIFYKPEREWIDPLRLHQRVQIGREDERGAALWIRPQLVNEPAFNTTNEGRKQPQDIWQALLTVWDIAELTAWCLCGTRPSDNALSLGPPERLTGSNEEPARDEAPRAKADPILDRLHAGGAADDAVERLMRRAAEDKPSTNGKH